MNDNKMTLEELQLLKDLITKLDEDSEVFKLSNTIIDINEKKLVKELNQKEGDSRK